MFVATSSALVLDRVAMIVAWLSMVSAFTVAAQAKVSNDFPSLAATSSRALWSAEESWFLWRVAGGGVRVDAGVFAGGLFDVLVFCEGVAGP